MKEKRLLALDQSSRITGWSYFEDNKLIISGHIDLHHDEVGDRLVTLKKEVLKLIHKYDINEVAFEDIQMQNSIGNNVQTFKVLAEVYGIILMLCTELQIPYTVVSASSWKANLNITGKRRAEQKKNAQQFVFNTYNVKVTQDEADSICIGTYTINNPDKKTRVFDEGINLN